MYRLCQNLHYININIYNIWVMINNNWRVIKYHKTELYTNIYKTKMLLFYNILQHIHCFFLSYYIYYNF